MSNLRVLSVHVAEKDKGPQPSAEQAYLARLSAREGYKRAMDTCEATRGAWASSGG